jgi:hypothetical protein
LAPGKNFTPGALHGIHDRWTDRQPSKRLNHFLEVGTDNAQISGQAVLVRGPADYRICCGP